MTRRIQFPRMMKNKINSRIISLLLIAFLIFTFLPLGEVNAAGASFYLAPSSGTYVIGGSFSVSVRVNTGGQAVNAAEGAISYDADILEVTGVSKAGSIFSLWTTEPAGRGGSISFGGGIPHPGYTGAGGQIFSVSFKTKKAGTAQIRFTSGAVLANDGKGTNILASMGSGSYVISPKVTAPDRPAQQTPSTSAPEPPKVEAEYNKPKISSETHPDENKWFNKSKSTNFAFCIKN